MADEPVVRAVDVGRGNVKYIARAGAEMKCAMFPAEAIPREGETPVNSLDQGKRKTIDIPVKDLFYTVGPDVRLAAGNINVQMLQHDAYFESDEYLALTLGALHYMDVATIDLLVVGLPVAATKHKRTTAALEKRLQGKHRLGKGRIVDVARVKTLAQPTGALLYYGSMNNSLAELRKQKSLIIDCGRRTTDWVVTEGMAVIDKRSHSIARGMFDVIASIAAGISNSINAEYRDFDAIDEALRTNRNPVIFQADYVLKRHLPLARKIPQQAVAEMLHYVGEASDIGNIILVGGGNFFFKSAVKAAFPHHKITEITEPLYANVLGFQIGGTQVARKQLQSTVVAPVGGVHT